MRTNKKIEKQVQAFLEKVQFGDFLTRHFSGTPLRFFKKDWERDFVAMPHNANCQYKKDPCDLVCMSSTTVKLTHPQLLEGSRHYHYLWLQHCSQMQKVEKLVELLKSKGGIK